MASLRDTNPLLDSDLALIISAFEKGMIKSRDVDSVFVPFRRLVMKETAYASSVEGSIDSVPLPPAGGEETAKIDSLDNPLTETEDQDDLDWDKVEKWVTDCVPCTEEFKRTISSLNADFFSDIGDQWSSALQESLDRLENIDSLLEDADANIINPFCDLGNALKFHCIPDLQKMAFVLQTFLGRMELDISVDLGIFDSFLNSALEPIFNELAANLDLIDLLILAPMNCVLDQIRYQISSGPQTANALRNAALSHPASTSISHALNRTGTSEAERAANRARENEEQTREREASARSAVNRASDTVGEVQEGLNTLASLDRYLSVATNWLKERKARLLRMIEELLSRATDEWNQNTDFAVGKKDILTYISLIKALIEGAKNGDFSCGPESGSLTEEDVIRFSRYWTHPSERLEIITENGNIIARRVPENTSTEGIMTGTDGDGVSSAENIVATKPIASCLKKVTGEEERMVSAWIRQLGLE